MRKTKRRGTLWRCCPLAFLTLFFCFFLPAPAGKAAYLQAGLGGASRTASGLSFSEAGRLTNLVVFLRFSGEEEFVSGTRESVSAAVPKEEQSGGGNRLDFTDSYEKVSAYFNKVSEGAFTVDTIPLTADLSGQIMASYEDPRPRSYYQPKTSSNPNGYPTLGGERYLREQELFESALEAVLPSLPEEALLDRNGDGLIDNVTFIVSGIAGSPDHLLWPHSYGLNQSRVKVRDASGEKKRAYHCNLSFASPRYAGVGVLCHELMHTLGFPDLYRIEDLGVPVGGWDVMASTDYADPQFPCAYLSESRAGWKHLEEIPGSGTYTLFPLGSEGPSPDGYRIPTGDPTQFLVAEYRKNGAPGDVTQDNVPGDGLLVYRVDLATAGGNGAATSKEGGDEIYVFRPGDTSPNAGVSKGLAQAALNGSQGRSSFGSSQPGTGLKDTFYFRNGENTRIVISEVAEREDGSISFRVALPEDDFPAEPGSVCDLSSQSWTISQPGEYRITGTSTEHSVTVTGSASGVRLVLENAEIDLAGSPYRSPILLRQGGEAELVLSGENTLSGGQYAPAVWVEEGASLSVSGSGSLAAFGGDGAAALGGGPFLPAGKLAFTGVRLSATGGGAHRAEGVSYVLQGGPAPALGAGSGQTCQSLALEASSVSAVSTGGVCLSTGEGGGGLTILGGSLTANGAVYGGGALSCEDAQISISREPLSDSKAWQAALSFGCLDSGRSVTLRGCRVAIDSMSGGSAVGSRTHLPQIEAAGGSLRAFSQDYTLCGSPISLDGALDLLLASGKTETLFSACLPGGGDLPAPVQPGVPSGGEGRASLVQGMLESALAADTSFFLTGLSERSVEYRLPAGTAAFAFSAPAQGICRLENSSGETTEELSIGGPGVQRIAPLALSRRIPAAQELEFTDGKANISHSGEYVLRGTAAGTVFIEDGLEVTLRLEDAVLTAPRGKPAVSAGTGVKLTLLARDGGENRLTGGAGQPALWAGGEVSVGGQGSLLLCGGDRAAALSAADVSLVQGCDFTAVSGQQAALVRRAVLDDSPWGPEGLTLLQGVFTKAFTADADLCFQGETGLNSCRIPRGALSFFRSLPKPGSYTISDGSGASSPQFFCAAGLNTLENVELVPPSAEIPTLDISEGDILIRENGSYILTGSTDRHTISIADGVTAVLLLKDLRLRLTEAEALEGRKGLIQLGERAFVTLSNSQQTSSLLNQVPKSSCGVVYVPSSSRLTLRGDKTLTAMPGRNGMLFGAPAGEGAGEIVVEEGDIQCFLPEKYAAPVLVGGEGAKVEIKGGSLETFDGACGSVGGSNSTVRVSGGSLTFSGIGAEGLLGGINAKVSVSGGQISLEVGEAGIGLGGPHAQAELSGGSVSVRDGLVQEGGPLCGMGGPSSLVRITGGSLTTDFSNISGTGGVLGGPGAVLVLSDPADVKGFFAWEALDPLAGCALEGSSLPGGFLYVRFGGGVSGGVPLQLTDVNGLLPTDLFSLPQQRRAFFRCLPQGMYGVAAAGQGYAGAVEVFPGSLTCLDGAVFGCPQGLWLEACTVEYDGLPHYPEFSASLPEDASVSYGPMETEPILPGVYPVSAQLTIGEDVFPFTSTVTIEKAPLLVTGAALEDKPVYDGSRALEGKLLLSGGKGQDIPTAFASFTFDTPDVGTDKPVSVSGVALDPQWEDRYVLSVAPGALEGLAASVLERDRAKLIVDCSAALQVRTEPEGLSCTITGGEDMSEKPDSFQLEAAIDDKNYHGFAALGLRPAAGSGPEDGWRRVGFQHPLPEETRFTLVSSDGKTKFTFTLPQGCQAADLLFPAGEGFLLDEAGALLAGFSTEDKEFSVAGEAQPETLLDLSGKDSLTLTESGVYRLAGLSAEPELSIRLAPGVCAVLIPDGATYPEAGAAWKVEGGSSSAAVIRCEKDLTVRGSFEAGSVRLEGPGKLTLLSPGETAAIAAESLQVGAGLEITAQGPALSGGRLELAEGGSFAVRKVQEASGGLLAVVSPETPLFWGAFPETGLFLPASGGVLLVENASLPGWRQTLSLPGGESPAPFLLALPQQGTYTFTLLLGEGAPPLTAEVEVTGSTEKQELAFQLLPELSGLILEDQTWVYDGLPHSLSLEGLPQNAEVAWAGNLALTPGEYPVQASVRCPGYRTASFSATLTIEKRPLEVSAKADDKEVYDGSAETTGAVTLTGALPGDAPAATGKFTFDTPDVGAGKTVFVTEIAFTGAADHWDALYRLEETSLAVTAQIKNKAELSPAFAPESLCREYGAVAPPELALPQGVRAVLSYDGEESLPSLPGSYQVSAVVEDKNYRGAASGLLTILPKTISPAGVSLPSLREDAEGLEVSVTDSPDFDAAASGVLEGDRVLLNYTARYPDLTPGKKTALLQELFLSGAEADRYVLSGEKISGTGEVLPKPGSSGGGSGGGSGGSETGPEGNPPDGEGLPFLDIQGHWAQEDILALWELGLMTGVGEGRFAPEDRMDRAMLVTVLCRLSGDALPQELQERPFPDVPADSWYAPYVAWAEAAGVAQGTERGLFRPAAHVTREQIAVFLYRFAFPEGEQDPPERDLEFKDAGKVSDWALPAVSWAVEQGILRGRDNGRLDPLGRATRAEVAAMISRFL